MFVREFDWRRFVHAVWGTDPAIQYCLSRGFTRHGIGRGTPTLVDELRGWRTFRSLPQDAQAAIEFDARRVNELASAEGNALLLEATGDADQPPADVPAGEGVALWYLVNRPDVFRSVFQRHRPVTTGYWRIGRTTPHLPAQHLNERARDLATALPRVCSDYQGRPSAVVDGYATPEGFVFEAHVAERLRRVTSAVEPERAVLTFRPISTVVFAYEAASGFVHLYSEIRSQSRAHALFEAVARHGLKHPLQPVTQAYDLERLKLLPTLWPDAIDMESVRVKSLTLSYPPHLARRKIVLDTSVADHPRAVYELLQAHVPSHLLSELSVTQAELLVRLSGTDGGRTLVVRLWPDACSLGYDWLGTRLLRCLARWGLTTHA